MKKILLPMLALVAVLTGCNTPMPDTVTYYDEIGSGRTDMIPENLLESPEKQLPGAAPLNDLLWLNAVRIARGADREFYFEVCYKARAESGLIEIPPGRSLVVTIDDKEVRFQTLSGSLNNRQKKKGIVTETAIFTADADHFRQIAEAKQVKVKVVGQKAVVERAFGPANFDRFKKFVKKFPS